MDRMANHQHWSMRRIGRCRDYSARTRSYEVSRYDDIAYYLHELTCDDRRCTYGIDSLSTGPTTDTHTIYHCQNAVDAENCAAAIVRGKKRK